MSRRNGSDEVAERRFLDGVGLAARAGRLRIGFEAVRRSILRGEARTVVIAGDASRHVRRKIGGLLRSGPEPPMLIVLELDGERLGGAVGRARVVALAVTDASMGRQVETLAERLLASGGG